MVIVEGRKFITKKDGNVPHEVNVNTICVDIHEVTQLTFQSKMGDNPSHFKGVSSRPVENVTWFQAKTFCQLMGKRLPNEWEWENAAGIHKNKKYYWENKLNDEFSWFNGNSSSRTNSVGGKKPNSNGLYDMIGNVWEWTDSGEDNIKYLRGGSWNTYESGMRISDRRRSDPYFLSSTYGFRCVQ
jgi:formylglycine-generating enzyme required for sulfatase activity